MQGNLMGAKGFQDFSYKYLLVPSITHWTNKTLPEQYTVSGYTVLMIHLYYTRYWGGAGVDVLL